MLWFLVGASAVVAALLIAVWFTSASTTSILRLLRVAIPVIAIVIGLFLIISGRIVWAWVALMALLPWVARLRSFINLTKAMRGRTSGQVSEVRTRFVHMTLELDTGEMDGEVQEEPYKGRRLSKMTLSEIINLYRLAMLTDSQSASVIEAYLDRMHGEAWRAAAEAPGSDNGAKAGPMTIKKAREILGVKRTADAKEIKRAHRRLMHKYHPDKGGSDYLAAQINEAKDILLEKGS